MSDRLAEIRDREQAATPGPWTRNRDEVWTTTADRDLDTLVAFTRTRRSMYDAHFIAAARSDVPWLLAEVARLARVEQAAQAYIAGWDDEYYNSRHGQVFPVEAAAERLRKCRQAIRAALAEAATQP